MEITDKLLYSKINTLAYCTTSKSAKGVQVCTLTPHCGITVTVTSSLRFQPPLLHYQLHLAIKTSFTHRYTASFCSLLLFCCSQLCRLSVGSSTTSSSLLLALQALQALQTSSELRRSPQDRFPSTRCIIGPNWCHATVSASLGCCSVARLAGFWPCQDQVLLPHRGNLSRNC